MTPLRRDHLDQPHPGRLPPRHPLYQEILERHRRAVSAGLPSYRDPLSGLQVLTAATLARRGECCSSGCRHCPYIGADEEGDAAGAPR